MLDVSLVIILVHLVTNTRHGTVPGFELHDVKTGVIAPRLSGRPQSATCLFCRKTVASWKGRPASKRGPRASALLPKSLEVAIRDHMPACAEAWMWNVLARWSTKLGTAEERTAVTLWSERHRASAPAEMARIFAMLPHPPNSDLAQHLEVALIAISRLWDP